MTAEAALRRRLGIPGDAAEVLVLAESTHWDPDWLLTSTEYLRWMVVPTLDRALDALVAEPGRIYSVECAFFPEAYLRVRPERRDDFVRLANEGRLRFTGGGVTTPDTLLPEDEALLRDLGEGARWLRAQGITAEPRSLYLPDSFGHSPGLPALLAAAGIDRAGICRIDGMRFPGAELEPADRFPWPGTSAERLVAEGSADFWWRSPDGSQVLTHWHAFSYGHGDMIGHGGFNRAMGLPLAWPSRAPDKVAARIEGYLDQLRPLARTPYLLLTIGFDFSRPVTRLTELIDRWNATRFEGTGVWLVNAALDDYLDLVATRADQLPVLELDPNPYWMGFYASRPELKRACRDLGRALVALDNRRARHALAAGDDPHRGDPPPRCDEARWIAATSNHHDLITGTSPDRTVRKEQWPWLRGALAEVTAALEATDPVAGALDDLAPDPADSPGGRFEVTRSGSMVTVATAHFVATFDEAHGGTLRSLVDTEGSDLVAPRTLSCVAIAERGGLWRMGNEFPGGRWRPVDATADHPATVQVASTSEEVTVRIGATLEGRDVVLEVGFPHDAPVVTVTTTLVPRLRRSITLTWRSDTPASGVVMHQPGAVVTRPLHKRFTPTFWPLHSWAVTAPAGRGARPRLGVATAVPTAVTVQASGTVEVVVARTAPRELAWGVVPLLGPAMGYERGEAHAHLAFGWPVGDEPPHRVGTTLVARADATAGRTTPEWIVTVDDPDTEVVAVKPADRGPGTVVRLRNWSVDPSDRTRVGRLRLRGTGDDSRGPQIRGAWRCDATERDEAELAVHDGAVEMLLDTHLQSVRLLT